MEETIRDVLTAANFKPEQVYAKRRAVSVKENGQRYKLNFKEQRISCVYSVDGDIVQSGQRCDKLILAATRKADTLSWTEIFVELKGRDVTHAIEQLRNTLMLKMFIHPSVKKTKYARIVAKRIPSNSGRQSMERAKREFIQKLHCDLRAIASGREDCISEL